MKLNGKKVLVTGGTGLIGQKLISILKKENCQIKIVSLDNIPQLDSDIEFQRLNLTDINNCKTACEDVDVVFNLIGIKASPKIIKEQPADIFVPLLQFNTNMMEAAFRKNVDWYLYTSTVGVYPNLELMREDDVWDGMPSKNDWFGGWAKRMGELQADVYKIQYGWDKVSIIRPANTYGPYDNFDPKGSMVVPSLIHRLFSGENPLNVWGDGSQLRDLVYSEDVASQMMTMVKNEINTILNSGSGKLVSIKELVNVIIECSGIKGVEIFWDKTKPIGDVIRFLDMTKAKTFGITPKYNLYDGIKETIDWYIENKNNLNNRYDYFSKK